MSGTALRERLSKGGIIVAPGIYDQISLMLAEDVGFDALYASGYWGTASSLGEPDVGIAGYADFIRVFGGFAARSSLPVIADADTGFGSLANLAHAVRGYQSAGIAAMQIEDQPFPKICGHVGRATSVPAPQMLTRIAVAVEARGEGDMMIIARTDARRSEGIEKAIERLKAYEEAGADVVFFEAPESREEIAAAAEAVTAPLMVNAAPAGKLEMLDPSEYESLGVGIAIYPSGAPLAAAAAAQSYYRALKKGSGKGGTVAMLDFGEMNRLIGMDSIIALQERHGDA